MGLIYFVFRPHLLVFLNFLLSICFSSVFLFFIFIFFPHNFPVYLLCFIFPPFLLILFLTSVAVTLTCVTPELPFLLNFLPSSVTISPMTPFIFFTHFAHL